MSSRREVLRHLLLHRPGLVLHTVAVVLSAPLAVRLSFPRLARCWEPRARTEPRATGWEEVLCLVDDVVCVLQPLARPGCLTRGLSAYRILRADGYAVVLRFGAGQVDGVTAAHCWLERDGSPFGEKVDPMDHFLPVVALPLVQ